MNAPEECKWIGSNIVIDRKTWNPEEVSVMTKALQEKFRQNRKLKDYLKKTGDLQLAEASPTDRFWGTGVGLGKTDTLKQQQWKGRNKLGQLLMALRSQLD